jgi:hypothetical protein
VQGGRSTAEPYNRFIESKLVTEGEGDAINRQDVIAAMAVVVMMGARRPLNCRAI